MQPEEQETPMEFIAATTWQTTLFLGVATVILGLIVSFHPSGSLNVIAVLVGILMIISGLFHLIRVFDSAEQHRVWLGIAGLLYVVIGVVLIRHLNLTVAVIGLIVGLTWIVSGLSALFGGVVGSREGVAGGSSSVSSASLPGSWWWRTRSRPSRCSPSCSGSGSSSWA